MGLECEGATSELVDLKDRWVNFRISDAYLPSPQELMTLIYSDRILQGKVMGVSHSGQPDGGFVVLEVDGVPRQVVVPITRLLGVV